MNSSKLFEFCSFNDLDFESDHVFLARLRPDIFNVDELFESLYHTLWLPCYFGRNWDALNECINDLSMQSERKVILIHENLPDIDVGDLRIYIDILREAIGEWRARKERNQKELIFEVVFPESCQPQIELLLKESDAEKLRVQQAYERGEL